MHRFLLQGLFIITVKPGRDSTRFHYVSLPLSLSPPSRIYGKQNAITCQLISTCQFSRLSMPNIDRSPVSSLQNAQHIPESVYSMLNWSSSLQYD